jgi:cell volume regulation protein A
MLIDRFLFFVGGTILLGFISRAIFERTRIPDVLILMGFGVFLGASLSFEDRLLFYRAAPYVGTLVLIMILFEGGLRIEPSRALEQARPALALSFMSFWLSALFITGFVHLGLGWELMPALLLGIVLGCTSSAIVIPVAGRLAMPEETRTLLSLEATFSDTFAIVALVTVIGLAEPQDGWLVSGLIGLARSFGIAAGVALAVSIVWLLVLEYTKRKPLSYLLTFAAIILLYGAVERWHGSGAIAVLMFGILITESRRLPQWLFLFGKPAPSAGREEAHDAIQWFHQELTFLLRTFFFVYLGLLFESGRLTQQTVWICAAFGALLVLGRAVSVYALRGPLAGQPQGMITAFLPRGLVTAVLATLQAAHGMAGTERFLDYAVPTIILTCLMMGIGLLIRPTPRAPAVRNPSWDFSL